MINLNELHPNVVTPASGMACILLFSMMPACAQEKVDPNKWAQDRIEVPRELQDLFSKPEELMDHSGKALRTGLRNTHPLVMDWNRDGVNDLVLGATFPHAGIAKAMGKRCDRTRAMICYVKNVGTNQEPSFKLPYETAVKEIEGSTEMFKVLNPPFG